MKKPLNFVIFIILSSYSIYAQNCIINGTIRTEGDLTSNPMYSIIALRSDSTIYKGELLYEENFSFTVNLDSISLLKFSSLGYQSVFISQDTLLKSHITGQLNIPYIKIFQEVRRYKHGTYRR